MQVPIRLLDVAILGAGYETYSTKGDLGLSMRHEILPY